MFESFKLAAVVAPFKETAPVPVLKVTFPVWPILFVKLATPCTASVEPIVVAPFREIAPLPVENVVLPVCEIFPVAEIVVNAPDEALVPPIGVLLIEPPVIAAPEEAKLFAVTKPLEFTDKAVTPLALTLNGFSVEPLAVATFNKYPVPLFEEESARLNKFELPVVAP
jgi:hypothetical protein